jgi:cytochrome c biogenesis protein CcmG/thiol:disulfide interchange protein DsbE
LHKLIALSIAFLALVACASDAASSEGELPEMDVDAFVARLESSEKPAVVNVWASWCLPCRDEAPHLRAAHQEYGEVIDFYGIAYNDNQPGARQFLDEFDLTFTNYFDFDGNAPAHFGGFAIPRTFFFGPGGELVETFNGVLTEDILTSNIEELLLGP